MNIKLTVVLALFLSLVLNACSKDKLEEIVTDCPTPITYENGAKAIVKRLAHMPLAMMDQELPPGNFTSYQGMIPFLKETSFENRVLIVQDMPLFNAPGPKSLTESQLSTFRCWIENNYEEE